MADPKTEPKATTGLETVTAPVVSEPTVTTPAPTGEALTPVGAPGTSVAVPGTAAPPAVNTTTTDSIPAITVKDVDSASQAGPQRVFSAPNASRDAPPTTSEPTPLALLWQVRAFQPP